MNLGKNGFREEVDNPIAKPLLHIDFKKKSLHIYGDKYAKLSLIQIGNFKEANQLSLSPKKHHGIQHWMKKQQSNHIKDWEDIQSFQTI